MRDRTLRIGTRGSALALWQARYVADRLSKFGCRVEVVTIKTTGDKHQWASIRRLGGRGIFTREIQKAVLEGSVDLAVHSMKDLPTEPVQGLTLGAVPERGSVCDVLVSNRWARLNLLPPGACVGTGSLRRTAQLLHLRPDLRVVSIRGNVDTRLGKVESGECDAVILAQAGLERLGKIDRAAEVIPAQVFLPAPGQGALAIEAREDDRELLALLKEIDHQPTHASVVAERAFLARLNAGCLAPVGGWARWEEDGRFTLTGRVLSPDGKKTVEDSIAEQISPADTGKAVEIGERLAQKLLEKGAAQLIELSRQMFSSDSDLHFRGQD